MKDCYLTLSSTHSLQYYPSNNGSHFRVKLDPQIKLDGTYYVGLCQLHLSTMLKEAGTKSRVSGIYVFTNMTSSYRVGESYTSVIRYIPQPKKDEVFTNPFYIEVDGSIYDSIEVYIMSDKMKPISFEGLTTTCTLHIRRHV